MKWLVDAQLPARLARVLNEFGENAIHTTQLPEANRTIDAAILDIADRDDRIIVTKDADFVASFRLTKRPRRLLLVATGNISNSTLVMLFLAALPELREAFSDRHLIELHAGSAGTALLVIHP